MTPPSSPAPAPRDRRVRRHPGADVIVEMTVPKLALTIEEACRALTISRPTLYTLIGQGRLRTVKIGRRRLVPTSELERFLAA